MGAPGFWLPAGPTPTGKSVTPSRAVDAHREAHAAAVGAEARDLRGREHRAVGVDEHRGVVEGEAELDEVPHVAAREGFAAGEVQEVEATGALADHLLGHVARQVAVPVARPADEAVVGDGCAPWC